MNADNRRILVIDDNPAIHGDFRKILLPRMDGSNELDEMAAELFDEPSDSSTPSAYQVDFALQGADALTMVVQARAENRPYAVAFIDVRMPPGWDGIETAARIWQQDPDLQIVICTAYSDYSWTEIRQKLGHPDCLVILKKPFDNIEVLQLAEMLTEKWRLTKQAKHRFDDLERIIHQRTHELQASNAHLDVANQQLQAAALCQQQAMNTQVRLRHVLQSELRQALEAGEFTVHYQPVIDTATRRIVSLEALVRWQHPRDGLISPATFIPVAEESGLIVPLGEFVLRTACQQMMRWEQEGVALVPVAVNVSAVQLERVNMWKLVRNILRETGMQPQYLALEITESSLIEHGHAHLKHLHGLRRDGVRILIDDFGTGYSSLSYLKQLPIDTLKIDRSFISQVDRDSQDETIVRAIITMAHSLGFKVVAEGVETTAQLEALRKHGCELVQGYLFSRPVAADACRKLLSRQTSGYDDTLPSQLVTHGCEALQRAMAG
jgi:EAL domain-containing protein (putative c-di-GMP-specific phosphodiesterase class I)/FixJ family two-component response regulator